MINRDNSIDILRFIGLSLIILAHVNSPNLLAQIRCFDVPLMIFISGLTASQKTFPNYSEYLIKRSKRLLIPVYTFLTIYIGVLIIAQSIRIIPYYIDLNMIIDSYLLLGGVGYVWIIRVFLLMMLITPPLASFEKYCKSNILYGCSCLAIFLLNNMLINFVDKLEYSFTKLILYEYVVYITGYMPLLMLGLRMRYLSRSLKMRYFYISIITLIVSIFAYKYFQGFPIILSPKYKYPPQSYYILYGIVISIVVWAFNSTICKIVKFLKISSLVIFVGQNTIWIYLWHIPFVLLANQFINNWIIRYFLVYCAPLLLFLIQFYIVKKVKHKFITKYFIG